MIFFSGCKINLGLRILRRRDDGFHDIETIFYPLGWRDAIEYLPQSQTGIEVMGRAVQGAPSDNYVLRAYDALVEHCALNNMDHALPALQFTMLKNIPMGAGLGGGSANAASTLAQLHKDFALNIDNETLLRLASGIGSDCAFFLRDTTCLATGRGDELQPIQLDLSGCWLFVLFPDVHISTALAYRAFADGKLSPTKPPPLRDVIEQPLIKWKNTLVNDFETVVFALHPLLAEVKAALYQRGAAYAAMSGSGSSVYGTFTEKPDLKSICSELNIPTENCWLEPGRRFG